MWIEVQGERIFAATGGVAFDPARPAVVLVHGAGMDHSVWTLHDRALAHAGRAVLSVDLPGHGRSEGEALASIPALAQWLAALLDAVGIGQAAVAGHSMGALAALSFAARFPARARAAALLGAAAQMPVNEDLRNAAREKPAAAAAMIVGWGFSAEAALGGSAAPGLWLTGTATSLLAGARPGVLAADLEACNDYADGLSDAARVRCPALVIAGERDRMSPAKAGRELAAALPHGDIRVLPGAGHMVMAERPDAVLDLLQGL
ncbi:MAG: alpha/beta hydrolase [Magnetospirillum sp.]|nr:alpha/beta hydrolase [Magnetospirillum sp.]